MSGTYQTLPSPTSPFWGEAVADFASLPPTGTTGESALTLDTGGIYYWTGAAWALTSAALSGAAAADTNSIDTTIALGVITADLRLSANAADVNNTIVGLSIQSAGSVGLRAQIANADVRALISVSDTTSIDLTYSSGAISGVVLLSPNAADSGFLVVPINIEANGLRAQITQASVRGLFSSANGGITYDNTTGVFTLVTSYVRGLVSATAPIFYDSGTGIISFSGSLDDITAITTGSAAAVGKIGQILSNQVDVSTTTGVGATTVWGNVTSISVAAGEWEISSVALFEENGATLTSDLKVGASTATDGSTINIWEYSVYPFQLSGGSTATLVGPSFIYRSNSPTTFYLNTMFSYTSGTPKHAGKIMARRIR